MDARVFLGIPAVAWLTDDEITPLIITNDYRCKLSVYFLSEVANATLELFIMIMD
jgi:hypothetical protein